MLKPELIFGYKKGTNAFLLYVLFFFLQKENSFSHLHRRKLQMHNKFIQVYTLKSKESYFYEKEMHRD